MRYYPTEFIAAMLNSVMGINEKVAYYIRFANSLGIQVLPPDINESYSRFTVKGNTIRFGLAAIKNVGLNVIESIVESRDEKGKFTSLMDFCNKIDISAVNKRSVESLVKAGAFDNFKVYRSKLLAVYEKMLDGINNQRKRNIEGQLSLFEDFKDSFTNIEVKFPEINEFEKKYLLAMEKEMTGLYLSGHPLDEYEQTLNLQTNTKISEILVDEALEEGLAVEGSQVRDGDKVVIGGIITEVVKKITKSNAMMAFFKLEDLYGTVEVIVFPKMFEKYKSFLQVDGLVLLKGTVSIREDEQPKVLCDVVEPLLKLSSEKLYIQVEEERLIKKAVEETKYMLTEFKGNMPVYFFAKKERKAFRLDRELWITNELEILAFLRKKFGDDNVKIQ